MALGTLAHWHAQQVAYHEWEGISDDVNEGPRIEQAAKGEVCVNVCECMCAGVCVWVYVCVRAFVRVRACV